MSERSSDRKWAAFEVGLVVCRQVGKGSLLEARQLAGLTLLREELAIHTAHEFKTGYEHFLRMVRLVEHCPDIDRQVVRIRRGAGEQAIEMRNGSRLRFLARSSGSGRGFSADAVYFDEAYALTDEMVGAAMPALSARKNPQVWYSSSAAKETSTVLHRVRERAIAGKDARLFYAEWSVPEGTSPDDKEAWYEAIPALGVRISEEFIEAERAALPEAEFLRERLSIPDPLPTDTVAPPKLDQERWNDTAVTTHHDVTPGDCTLAYDVHQGWTTISIQTGSLASSWGAVVDHFKGTARLPERMAYFAAKYKPTAIGLDKGNGESFGELGAIVEHFEAEDLSTDAIKPVTPEAYKAACQAIVSAVEHGTAQRPKLAGIDQLQIAGEKATERIVGGGFVFDRKSSVPLSPLVSWLIARSLLAEEKPRSKALNTRSSLRARSSSL